MYDNKDVRSEVLSDVARLSESVRFPNLGSPESSRWESNNGIRDSKEYCMVHNNSVLDP